MSLSDRVYRLLLLRNRATLYWIPSRYRIEAKEYLWRHAEAIVGSGDGEAWLERWR